LNQQEATRAVIVNRLRAGRIQMETSITSRRTLRRCGGRRSSLLALMTATLLTILYVASLKSFATNSRIWSRRWRSWWGPLTLHT